MQGTNLGKVLVPQSKHYSWTKAVDILGIGQENLISVPVQDDYRMDIAALKSIIDRLVATADTDPRRCRRGRHHGRRGGG